MCGIGPALWGEGLDSSPSSITAWPWASCSLLWLWLNTWKRSLSPLAREKKKMHLHSRNVSYVFQLNKADAYMHLSLLSPVIQWKNLHKNFFNRQTRKGTRVFMCFGETENAGRHLQSWEGPSKSCLQCGSQWEDCLLLPQSPERLSNWRQHISKHRQRRMAENKEKVGHIPAPFLSHPAGDWPFSTQRGSRGGSQWE